MPFTAQNGKVMTPPHCLYSPLANHGTRANTNAARDITTAITTTLSCAPHLRAVYGHALLCISGSARLSRSGARALQRLTQKQYTKRTSTETYQHLRE